MTGEISYNGQGLDQFEVLRTAAYIDQHDSHTALLTTEETLDFAARCQGIGNTEGDKFPTDYVMMSLFAENMY